VRHHGPLSDHRLGPARRRRRTAVRGDVTEIETRLTAAQLRKATLIAAAAAPLIRALGATYRWRVEGLDHYDAIVASGRQPIFAFWHGRILPATLFWQRRGIVVITSQNFDGEWIARIIRRFGYGTARGSTSRGGARALVQLRRDLRQGRPVGFTLDGPRGPREVIQPGAVWLAAATGQPVLPFHVEASPQTTLNTWDKTAVPAPWAKVAIAIGPPLDVPATDPASLAQALAALQIRLNDARRNTLRMLH
jgi:lysophospholipid acyltransferase (LPLAT)-like uncharacterized protein